MRYAQHARRHLPGGSDPLPVLGPLIANPVSVGYYKNASYEATPLAVSTLSNPIDLTLDLDTLWTNTGSGFSIGGASGKSAVFAGGIFMYMMTLSFESPAPVFKRQGAGTPGGFTLGLNFASAPTFQANEPDIALSDASSVFEPLVYGSYGWFQSGSTSLEPVLNASYLQADTHIVALQLLLVRLGDTLTLVP